MNEENSTEEKPQSKKHHLRFMFEEEVDKLTRDEMALLLKNIDEPNDLMAVMQGTQKGESEALKKAVIAYFLLKIVGT